MQKLEYKAVTYHIGGWFTARIKEADIQAMLNDLGKDGWELAAVTPVTGWNYMTKTLVLTLKRPL